MIKSKTLVDLLTKQGFDFITGVPCSILKSFLGFLDENQGRIEHIIATNEKEAIGIAAGYYLATSKISIVYMQNSGLANSVDILTSLMNKEVCSIPALLLVSWRGEPGEEDAPSHIKMGEITLKLLEVLDIPYTILSDDATEAAKEIAQAKVYLQNNSLPYALVIKKNLIESYQAKSKNSLYSMSREQAIRIVIDNLLGNEVVISTAGWTSRELFEFRETKKQSHQTDFYTVGSMGCPSAIALGIALAKSDKKIFIFDGDGSVLMQMGTLATMGHYLPKNLYHIIFDNNVYGSTGNQKTISDTADFCKVALACGYKKSQAVSTPQELIDFIKTANSQQSPAMLVIKINQRARKDLGRPTITPGENKTAFMKFLKKD